MIIYHCNLKSITLVDIIAEASSNITCFIDMPTSANEGLIYNAALPAPSCFLAL
jgi:hypothetical protein